MPIVAGFAVPHPPLILPAVGQGRERKIQGTIDAYDEVARRIALLEPDVVFVASPHAPAFYDMIYLAGGPGASGDMGRFGADDERMDVVYDERFVSDVCDAAEAAGIQAGTVPLPDDRIDHATFIPLWFINRYCSEYRVVRCGLSGLSAAQHFGLGRVVSEIADESRKKVVFVASGDLSHKLDDEGPYGFSPEGPAFDAEVIQIFESGDLRKLLAFDPHFCDDAGECGYRSFLMMAGALDGKRVEAELLDYEGPFGVGYGVASFIVR